MPGKELTDPCVDCADAEAILTVRCRRLCQDCYARFVNFKVFKRMENYRLRRNMSRTGPCKLLLPLSYGTSSSVLLHILNAQIQHERAKSHPSPGFELHVLVIEPSTVSTSSPPHDEGFDLLQQTFPSHSFTRVSLHNVFELDPSIQDVLSQFSSEGFTDDATMSDKDRLDAFRASITTATSRVDVDYILITRLVVAFAKKIECRGVVWGDSDTRLAAKTLANVAKGRGSAITWQVCDGMSPFGLEFSFPLRDLYKAEVQNYASFFPELAKIIIPDEPPSENILTKNLSIDELMMRYVQTQGEKYPGIMANVTRTASKLQASLVPANVPRCSFCGGSMLNQDGQIIMGGAAGNSEVRQGAELCYACTRSRPEVSY
ncbi:uncharacterized protein ACLA_015460 [Aspergillus clavatus NRRL 1]|uniref:Cytoplasmic tRNA 2-thiolation protein 2 n=1 Tax=Aspergillus clavatus (strain ATCC 1007 / CBS 513.65 / DSM 816 / NCTC 3887 / NRRL 1 / QM 1276 / 107) TaxID=344612 RepID=CTU2_ASPCL|nr:uncharacterized protein ACLA_015460 [Aspergillus clavatus NRRL 1]A1CBI6.1 RecName: Full=Cytoplasmic tRNA 2-thiolation protein 2 [Aspergillus clavatus NRRL 1]EAW13104.1 conserved hypothetical protein [Aspergillus clavatus NRRL 1]